MKHVITLLLVCMSGVGVTYASSPLATPIPDTTATRHGITFNVPAGYIIDDSTSQIVMAINMNKKSTANRSHFGFAYTHVANANDAQSRLLYADPGILSETYHHRDGTLRLRDEYEWARRVITDELYSSTHNGIPFRKATTFNPIWRHLITSHGGRKARQWGGADSVYVVDLPVVIPVDQQFTHCLGVVAVKRGRMPMVLKLLCTDSAYADRDKLLCAIRTAFSFDKALPDASRRK